MDTLNDEHRMLMDSLDGVLSSTGDAAGIWPRLAELGMLGLTLNEKAGGAGLGVAELLLFARGLGKTGLSTPYLASEVLAIPLLGELASHPAMASLLPDLIAGSRIATVALDDLVEVTATRRSGGGFAIRGVKTRAPAGAEADVVVIPAVFDGAPALFLLEMDKAGVSRAPYHPAGPGAGADLAFDGLTLPDTALLSEQPRAAGLIADARARGQLATCAGMLGGMEALLDLTVDYLRTRQQFGVPLSSFQVLQHAAVDMYVELETARAMLAYGVGMFGASEAERSRALTATKFKLNAAAKLVGETAVQLHGGIGMTEESLAGRIFARLAAERLSFGDSRSCLAMLVDDGASIALS